MLYVFSNFIKKNSRKIINLKCQFGRRRLDLLTPAESLNNLESIVRLQKFYEFAAPPGKCSGSPPSILRMSPGMFFPIL